MLSPHQRVQLLNSLGRVRWPNDALNPQCIVLGEQTKVLLTPHNGEVDFAAILGGTIPHEPEVFRFLESVLPNYDLVVEIGANVGLFTLFAARQMEPHKGKIYSFEPSPEAFRRLRNNLSINAIENVVVLNCAVSNRSGIDFFFEPEGHLMNGSLRSEFATIFSNQVRKTTVVTVSAEEIERLVSTNSRVLLKIDTEGAEALILRSMGSFIKLYNPDILIEVLPDYEEEIQSAADEVLADYQAFAISDSSPIPLRRLESHAHRDCFLTMNNQFASSLAIR